MQRLAIAVVMGVGVMFAGWTARAAAAPGDNRTVFEYSGGVFVFKGGGQWVEKRDSGPDSRFKEVTRTAQFIELYDSGRDMKVRLYRDCGKWYDADTRRWVQWPGSEGRWNN